MKDVTSESAAAPLPIDLDAPLPANLTAADAVAQLEALVLESQRVTARQALLRAFLCKPRTVSPPPAPYQSPHDKAVTELTVTVDRPAVLSSKQFNAALQMAIAFRAGDPKAHEFFSAQERLSDEGSVVAEAYIAVLDDVLKAKKPKIARRPSITRTHEVPSAPPFGNKLRASKKKASKRR